MNKNNKETNAMMEKIKLEEQQAERRIRIVQNIERIRKEKGITREQLEKAIKAPIETTSLLEKHQQMAEILDVSFHEIIGIDTLMTPEAVQKLIEYRRLAERWQQFVCDRYKIPFIAPSDEIMLEHALADGIAAMKELLRINELRGEKEDGE